MLTNGWLFPNNTADYSKICIKLRFGLSFYLNKNPNSMRLNNNMAQYMYVYQQLRV